MTAPSHALVDWGTSSFRLWLVDERGDALRRVRSDRGMSALRRADFAPYLERTLDELCAPKDLPVLICGMAGAAQGWRNVPYLDVPAHLDRLAGAAVRMDDSPRDVRILPGLAQRERDGFDVMRGEETILLGAIAQGVSSATVCLPGTHSKWARLDGAAVTGFSTAMTGELFALLRHHSTLAHYLRDDDFDPMQSKAFQMAVQRALADPGRLLHDLFAIRAKPLLGAAHDGADLTAYLSGLLVGAEIAAGRRQYRQVILAASGKMGQIYAKAMTLAGLDHTLMDAAHLVLSGLHRCAVTIWKETTYG